jgi:hypothetical protein
VVAFYKQALLRFDGDNSGLFVLTAVALELVVETAEAFSELAAFDFSGRIKKVFKNSL